MNNIFVVWAVNSCTVETYHIILLRQNFYIKILFVISRKDKDLRQD